MACLSSYCFCKQTAPKIYAVSTFISFPLFTAPPPDPALEAARASLPQCRVSSLHRTPGHLSCADCHCCIIIFMVLWQIVINNPFDKLQVDSALLSDSPPPRQILETGRTGQQFVCDKHASLFLLFWLPVSSDEPGLIAAGWQCATTKPPPRRADSRFCSGNVRHCG